MKKRGISFFFALALALTLAAPAQAAGNGVCRVSGLEYASDQRLQTVPIKVADGVALPSYCTPSSWATGASTRTGS